MATSADHWRSEWPFERLVDRELLRRGVRLARLVRELLFDGIRLAAGPRLIPLTAGAFVASLWIDGRLHAALILGCCVAAGVRRALVGGGVPPLRDAGPCEEECRHSPIESVRPSCAAERGASRIVPDRKVGASGMATCYRPTATEPSDIAGSRWVLVDR
ncbi:MAG TPA: hypothetical protein DCQ98_19970 [Planctomycetaceae bacterium]|nr:hypothetical protein [Planctomycetaceae bacterium]HRF00070.1 hypothetical protein [Pirellulaceae bacterium]